jgi:predicted MPP superfamily phosphohydrolase
MREGEPEEQQREACDEAAAHDALLERVAARARRRRGAHRWLIFTRLLGWVGRVAYRGRVAGLVRRYLDRKRELTRVEIALPRGGAGLDGLRIAFLSDLHVGHYLDAADLLRVCEQLGREQPELLCLGGDLVNVFADEIPLLAKALSRLDPPLGKFAVPGNHDYYADPGLRHWREVLESCGVTVLLNAGRRIERGGAPLWLAGVDDLRKGQPELGRALVGRRTDEPVLLLSHHPDFFEEARAVGVEVTLSGHTHGGQVLLGGRTPLRHTRYGYWSGRFERAGSQLYVGRGAGVTLLPLRIGVRGELALITLRRPAP